ncbi:MAG: MFS transporter [Gemmatimonadota bacterium]
MYALLLLAAINVLNYLDRNVIFALFEPIKRDLGLTDTQLGWLGSAYILVFSVTALPAGVLSDIRSRRAVIAGGVAVWSAFTLVSGLVKSFAQLFWCRALVGVGEAAFGPASSSLVADYFPGKARALAMGVLSSGIALGGVLGILLGGQLEALYGWRVAFMAVAAPGFLFAFLAGRLKDPTRPPEKVSIRDTLQELGMGLTSLVRQLLPTIIGTLVGLMAAYRVDPEITRARLDIAVFSVFLGLGVAINFLKWVRQIRARQIDETLFGGQFGSAIEDLVRAGAIVLRTPTLKYVFVAGALVSFGMNGLVGWAPTFVARELGMTAADASVLLGKWGLIFGTAGTLFGGWLADQLRKYTESGRVIVVAAGLLIGGPLATWLLTLRDPAVFVPVFCGAFFCLTWYNGPLSATIFDVVPARISATVAGAYLLFIHLVGDAIAFPLVGMLSDRFGLDRAILLLPIVSVAGGAVVLFAIGTVAHDTTRAARRIGRPEP